MVDLPVGVRRTTVPSRRARLAALTAGESPQVLLVPGFTGSKEDYVTLLPELQERGRASVAIDLLGQHESPGTEDASEYTLPRLATDIIDIAQSMAGPVDLVGHSMGGLVSRAAVISRPDLFRSLVLLDSGPAFIPRENQDRLRALREALHGMTLEQIWAAKLELDAAAGYELPPPPVQAFLEQRWMRNNPYALAAMVEILLTAPDTTDELARVCAEADIPLLVAYGEGDVDSWPIDVQEEMAQRLGAPTVVVAHAGHSPAAENPRATAEALMRFWGDIDPEVSS